MVALCRISAGNMTKYGMKDGHRAVLSDSLNTFVDCGGNGRWRVTERGGPLARKDQQPAEETPRVEVEDEEVIEEEDEGAAARKGLAGGGERKEGAGARKEDEAERKKEEGEGTESS